MKADPKRFEIPQKFRGQKAPPKEVLFPLHPKVQGKPKMPWMHSYVYPDYSKPRPAQPGGVNPRLYHRGDKMSRDECLRRLGEMGVNYNFRENVGGSAQTDIPTYHELRHMVRTAEARRPQAMTPIRTPMGPPSRRLYQTPTPTSVYQERLKACGVEFRSKQLGTPAYRETVPPGIIELEYMCKEAEARKAEELRKATLSSDSL